MIERECSIRRVTPDDGLHYWFGYYDKCPWDSTGAKLLVHRTNFVDRFPEPSDPAEIGWVDPTARKPKFHKIGTTRAWNWQQGAQLRWWTDVDGFEGVMVNDRDAKGNLHTKILDLEGDEVHRVPHPLVAVTPDGRTGLTLSFGRLTRLKREYGLPGVPDPNPKTAAPKDDGVFSVDVGTGEKTLLIDMHRLDHTVAPGEPSPAAGDLHQHVNHIMLNPSGTRLCFMHRFARADGIQQSRLFTLPIEGGEPRLLFEGLCSHYDWKSDKQILAWAGKRALLGTGTQSKSPVQHAMTLARKTLKPIYYALGKPRVLMNKIMKDSYLLIPDAEDAPILSFARGELITDGHCTFNRGGREPGRWVLTDGYPDMKNRQPLFLWDCREDQGYEIGRYPTPRELDGDLRVDLHPRFNADGTKVCIDSAMTGKRGVYVVDVTGVTAARSNEQSAVSNQV
ncbi:MAG: hypothetical protein RIB60_00170 [Phycisphaerales bacterium]